MSEDQRDQRIKNLKESLRMAESALRVVAEERDKYRRMLEILGETLGPFIPRR